MQIHLEVFANRQTNKQTNDNCVSSLAEVITTTTTLLLYYSTTLLLLFHGYYTGQPVLAGHVDSKLCCNEILRFVTEGSS